MKYVKPKYGENTKLCWIDTAGFIVYLKRDDIYKDIAKDIKTRFDTSNFEIGRPLRKGKNKKSNCTNERWIRWKIHERTCYIKSKNI